jgi:SAM-dependent methyltransferase
LHLIPNSKPLVSSPYLALLGCEACGLVYASPRPDAAAAMQYYDAENDKGWKREEPDEHSPKMKKKRAAAAVTLAPVLSRSLQPGRALDYGCGAGAMLDVLQDGGWETVGLEPSRIKAYASRRHAIVDEVPNDSPFDLVILHHVLEHVVDVHGLLRRLHASARIGAHLIVGVPSLSGAAVTGDFKYACSALHINAFTPESLTNVLRIAGWLPFAEDGSVRNRLLLYATRQTTVVEPIGGALDAAVDALLTYGRRLDARGEFTLCPLEWTATS